MSPKLTTRLPCSSLLPASMVIEQWDISKVIDRSLMFENTTSFNSDSNKWDVSNVRDMASMFSNASSFNGDSNKWDVSLVTQMSFTFVHATNFNGDLSQSPRRHCISKGFACKPKGL